MSFFGRSTNFLSQHGKPGRKPPFEGLYVYLFALVMGYMAADLTVLSFREDMLPTQAPPSPPIERNHRNLQLPDLSSIESRNIFNSKGIIPPPLKADDEGPGMEDDAPAVLSQLPLSLEGTIVHMDPRRSVATVTLKNRNETQPFGIEDEIERMARVTKIERGKLTFRNLNNSRLEYIEIPKDMKITFGGVKPKTNSAQGEVVKQGEFDFQMKRSDIKKYTSDLSSILSQARMVPNIVPGSGGAVEGFRFVSIQPGSIYEKLGFKPMDVIKGVNGEPVNSPTKAMELYNALKSEDRLSLQIERNGRIEEFKYEVTE